MRICCDLDGTICENKVTDQSYSDVLPLPGAVERLQKFKAQGHHIIIYTARHMKTCNNNLGEITLKQGPLIANWLEKHKIPCDELWLSKPLADLYIDDKGLRFISWDQVDSFIKEHKE